MRKRILSMLCVFALCFTLLPVGAFAGDISDWETTPPTTTGGWTGEGNYDTSWFDDQNAPEGTENDPYIISNAADLAGLSVIVNGLSTYANKAYSFKDKYIEIADNATIDLAAHEWTPIGTKLNVYGGDIPVPGGSFSTTSTTAWFKGHFDGNNVPIKNLRITDSDSDVVGLFGYALEAVIENVKLEDAYISAVDVMDGTYVGGIVALSDGSTVQGCTVVSGLITAKNDSSGTSGYVGGIVGTNGKSLYPSAFQSDNASHVAACTNGAKIISATQYTGGIVGINGTANTSQTNVYCTVTGCINQGQIEVSSGSKFYAGGIAGGNLTTITNCKNEADVKNTTGHAAGIAGYFEGRAAYIADDANVLIQNCENTGAISGYSYVGGIVAYSYSGTDAAIAKCTNSGAIASLSGSAGNPEMGGIAGRVGSSGGKFTITNCVNTGSVSGEISETTPSSSGTNTVGGLVGTLRTSFEISNCYNTGAVTNYAATSSSLLVSTAGGLAGSVGTNGIVHDCYNVGEVKGYRVGGLIGTSTASGSGTPQLTDCYNIGRLTGTNVGGVLGPVMSGWLTPTITDCTYWNSCLSGGNSYGTSKSSNQMTGDSWSSEMGLDTSTWEKAANPGGTDMTGYLPVLTSNKQDPAPTLTRTGLTPRTLDITNIPTDGSGVERNSFLLSERSFDLNATVDPSGGTVSWATSNDKVATVDSNGKVTLFGPGEVSITASVAEDATHEKASASYTFTVTDTITEIIINGLGELSLGSTIPTSASTPDDAKYNIVPYISIGGGTSPDIHWTYADDTTITGTTFAAGYKYKGTIKVEPDTYYSFASDVEVKLSGVGTSVSYTHAGDTITPQAILITISLDYSKTQEEITGVQDAVDLVYNGQPQIGYTGSPSSAYAGDYEITYEGKGVDGTTYGPTSTAPTNAGDYTVLIAIPDSDTTYFGSVKLDFSIGKAAATVKALERNIYVGEEIPDLTNPTEGTDYEVDGLIGNDSLGGSISMKYQKDGTDVTPSNTTAGEYDIVISGTIENGNYEVTYSDSKLTISNRSGGGGVTTYTISIPADVDGGTVKVSPTRASSGTTVTITVTPDEGYALDKLTVTDAAGRELKLTDKGDGKYSFTMPGSKVIVEAIFAAISPDYAACDGGADCPLWDFTDLNVNAWYHDGVHYCLDEGLMEGYGGGLFGPNDTLSRAQLCQIVYNMEGQPAATGGSVFDDVADGAWYADAVTWAAENGIVGGYGNGKYGPDDPITREQLAAILWRYAKYKGYDVSVGEDTNILSYTDALEISEYAIPAMQWACGAGVIEGVTDSTLVPQGDATRAQAAVMLMRFCEEYVVW